MRVHISRFNKYMQTETSSEIYFFPLFFFFWSIYYGCISFCMRMNMKIFCGMLFFGSKKNNSIQSSLSFTINKCKKYQEKNSLHEIIIEHVKECNIS